MEKNAKNFAIWSALRGECYFFASQPAYYGGVRRTEELRSQMQEFCKKHNLEKDLDWVDTSTITAIFDEIGINWHASTSPTSDRAAEFNGTFAESSMREYLSGILVLNNGLKIPYYSFCEINIDQFESIQEFFKS